MGIPIISQVIDLVDTAIDKIWPDASTKEQAKAQMQVALVQQAMQDRKLLFEDTEGARELFKAELEAQNVPSWVRGFQALARPFTMYITVLMYTYVKISPTVGSWMGVSIPTLTLSEWDYYLIGAIFVFLFGARTIEKMAGKS